MGKLKGGDPVLGVALELLIRCSPGFCFSAAPKRADAVMDLSFLCRTDTGKFPEGRPPARWLRAFELLETGIVAAQATHHQRLPWRRQRLSTVRGWYFDALKAIACNCFQVRLRGRRHGRWRVRQSGGSVLREPGGRRVQQSRPGLLSRRLPHQSQL